jgi:hypothetical protein
MAASDPNIADVPSSNSDSSNAARPSWETPLSRPAAPARRPEPRVSAPPSPFDAPPAASIATAPVQAPTYQVPIYQVPIYQVPLETDVRYDLAGNPIPGSGSSPATASASLAPPAPFGYSAGPAAGTWPPAPVSPYGYGVGENGTDKIARLKWNWGAFLIPFWWSVFNGQRGIASVVVLLNIASRWVPAPYDWGILVGSLGVMIYLGAMGHRLAWSSDRFGGDYASFISIQRAWMIWGFVITGLISGMIVAAAVLLPGFLAGFTGGSSHASPNTYRPVQ